VVRTPAGAAHPTLVADGAVVGFTAFGDVRDTTG
jgi:hypothetical protein